MSLSRNAFPQWLADPIGSTNEHAPEAYRPSVSRMWVLVPLMIGLAGLAVSIVGWVTDAKQFYFSYLVAWTFCLSVTVGALFFVLIQHLTKARWSVVVRRIPEALIWSFPVLALLALPILFGMHDLYHWTHHELLDPNDPAYDPIIAGKAGYLNVPFFLARFVLYFAVWSIISYRLYTSSVREDVEGDPKTKFTQRKVSAVGLVLTALTTAFAAWDFLMSLDPHWFSTIFGVYFFGASFWSAHAFIALVAILLQRSGNLGGVINREHYHDLGKMMFGFTVFWAYIAFSQYMLIWYGNLPEETVWYRHRLEHGWEIHSAALLIGHFIIPFWVLLPKGAKRNRAILSIMAVWFLVMNWFDIHWMAMPVKDLHHAGFSWLDFSCLLGLFGVYFAIFAYRLGRHSLVPRRDPFLPASLAFVNH